MSTRIPLILMSILSFLIALGSYRFIQFGLPLAFPDFLEHIEARRLAFVLHVSLAPAALIFGSVQFYPKMRQRFKALHRWLGRGYTISVMISGVAGFIVALGAAGGVSAKAGFAILALLWMATTANAIRHAISRNIKEHQRWMLYSFALTFSGVTLRLYLLGFVAAGFSYTEASVYLAWLCWVPNLGFALWWHNR